MHEVKIGTEVVTTAEPCLWKITVLVTEVSNQVKGISVAVQQMASGSQQIVSSVKEIDEAQQECGGKHRQYRQLQRNNRHLWKIWRPSQSLAKMAQGLQEAISKFRV